MTNDLKGYQWWQEIMLLWENNIDHKMVITWMSFADEVKYFFNSMYKRRQCFNNFDTRADFGPYFWP